MCSFVDPLSLWLSPLLMALQITMNNLKFREIGLLWVCHRSRSLVGLSFWYVSDLIVIEEFEGLVLLSHSKSQLASFELEKSPLFVQRKGRGNDGGKTMTSRLRSMSLHTHLLLSRCLFSPLFGQSRKFIVRPDYERSLRCFCLDFASGSCCLQNIYVLSHPNYGAKLLDSSMGITFMEMFCLILIFHWWSVGKWHYWILYNLLFQSPQWLFELWNCVLFKCINTSLFLCE